VKRYEVLFILNLAGKEEDLNDAVERVKSVLTEAGAKVETIQKMDKKPFAQVTDKSVPAGHYVNMIFDIAPSAVAGLRPKFARVAEVYRFLLTLAPKVTATPAA